MPRMSVNRAKSIPKENNYFYGNEILPEFRARQKATLKELESVPEGVPNEVGMQTINPKTEVGKYFVEFSSGSSIHGLNHLVAPHRHPVEIFLAVLFIGGALVCLIFLSITFWDRYQNDATVITVDNDSENFKIMKPAVFICPVPNIEPSKFASVFENYSIENTPEAVKFFTFIANVNYENMFETPDFDKVPPNMWLKILHDIRRNIPAATLTGSDPYEAIVITERGLCLATRNAFAVYTTYEYWMSNNWTVVPISDDLPFFTPNDDKSQEPYVTTGDALFAVTDPLEVFSFDVPTKWLRPRLLQHPIMTISQIKTNLYVKDLSIYQRKCKFVSDGGLDTWPIYTMNMCRIECRMRVIQEHCNCRPHFARPIDGVQICNARQLRCIGNITDKLFLYNRPPPFCDCQPNCDLVTYILLDNEISELDLPTSSAFIPLTVSFPRIILYRLVLFNFNDFLTGVGGAAGLFLGASVLSFVEIIYYATIHACFYARRAYQKNKKSKIL